MSDPIPYSVSVCIIICYIIAVATCIVAPLYLYTVIRKSNQQMTTYRNLLLVQYAFSALITVTYLTTMPMFEDHTLHRHSYGIVQPKSKVLSIYC
uniref:G_PROTEIN_RECEP_F1_2 domain-containing protein n=1 Tax=Panagrellus redivivus TaxID=6233 RepID=A0A7E4UZN5_PANRE